MLFYLGFYPGGKIVTAEIIGFVDAVKLDWDQVTEICKREAQKEWLKEYKEDLKKGENNESNIATE